jgi:hypothetical protein
LHQACWLLQPTATDVAYHKITPSPRIDCDPGTTTYSFMLDLKDGQMYVSMSIHGCTPSCHAGKDIPIYTAGTTCICFHTPDICMRPCPVTCAYTSCHACNRVPIYAAGTALLCFGKSNAIIALNDRSNSNYKDYMRKCTRGVCKLQTQLEHCNSGNIAGHLQQPFPNSVNIRQGSKIPLC